MYDVIVVGARVAGASTAMLLARRGLARGHVCDRFKSTRSDERSADE
jgi:glycine/D-amino acid oxidase-like deaminating enzyme